MSKVLIIGTVTAVISISTVTAQQIKDGLNRQKTLQHEQSSSMESLPLALSEKLDRMVQAKKITSEEVIKIKMKQRSLMDEENSLRNELKDMDRENRLRVINSKRLEVAQWEKDNNVPTGILNFFEPVRNR